MYNEHFEQVCRRFFEVIDGTVTIRYKIALARAGMVDGDPQHPSSVTERLDRLRAFQDAFPGGQMHFYFCFKRDSDDVYAWPPSGGVLPYRNGATLNLLRPPSLSRGVPERRWSFSSLELPVKEVQWICRWQVVVTLFAHLRSSHWDD